MACQELNREIDKIVSAPETIQKEMYQKKWVLERKKKEKKAKEKEEKVEENMRGKDNVYPVFERSRDSR